jgi:hypothetical protein
MLPPLVDVCTGGGPSGGWVVVTGDDVFVGRRAPEGWLGVNYTGPVN